MNAPHPSGSCRPPATRPRLPARRWHPVRMLAPVLACLAAGLAARATEPIIGLPVMEPPQSDTKPGDFVFNLRPKSLQKKPQLEMTIRCELTPHGRTLPRVTPQQPAYYVLHDAGQLRLGETMNGEIPPPHLDALLVRALSANGYLPAEGSPLPPTLALIYHWGSSYEMPVEDQLLFPELSMRNRQERRKIIGADQPLLDRVYDRESILTGLMPGTLEDEALDTQAQQSLYFTLVSAYDYSALARGEHLLVWRANLTVGARGVAMHETLPALVLTASASFGRDTDGAKFVTRRVERGKVELGPLIFIESDIPLSSQDQIK